MKINVKVRSNLRLKQAEAEVEDAARKALRDVVVDIHEDSIKNAAAVGFWDTGNNARSIASEVSGMGVVKQGSSAKPGRVVDDRKLEGAVYSTSGYGGYGETGLKSKNYPARPYMKPALDKNIGKLGKYIKGNI